MSFFEQFSTFVKKFGVIGLAVGAVIGLSVKDYVDTIVASVVTPTIDLILGLINVDFATWNMEGSYQWGTLINDTISFIAILLTVFISVKFIVGRMLTEKEREDMGI